ncbi:MAG TPA: AAA family ATPase [Candidatus Dormibacteraeota bacterium]
MALVILVLLAAYAEVLNYSRPAVSGDALSFTQLVDQAGSGRILNAQILDVDSYVVGQYRRSDGSVHPFNSPNVKGANLDLVQLLAKDGVPVAIDQQSTKSLVILASYLLPSLVVVLLFVYLILSYRRGSGLFGVRSGARKLARDDRHLTFADIAGQDAAITELREVVQFLTDPHRFLTVGARVPKGLLLYGPPGCGKTLLARALAGESGASFYSISGSDFVEIYVGVGAARVRDLFKEARMHTPALIFIDELDSVGRARSDGAVPGSHGEQEQALNQILTEMDGFEVSAGIIVVGATNRPDILDPALLRPGRFDRTVGLDRPDESGRLAILQLHARDKPLATDAQLEDIAHRAVGLTGADLANVVNDAALLTAREGRTALTHADLDLALRRVFEAPERQRRLAIRPRSIGRRAESEQRVTFNDIAGMDDAIAELAEVRDYLADPDRYAQVGARVPRGILLVGPPGCGKTLLARAVAGDANAAFFSAAASEFVEIFVGQGAARVRDLFAEARSLPPAILFIDEIDAVGGARAANAGGGHREAEQTLNQILVELDGFEARTGVIVMAATNRIDMLDPALVRPGRFDRRVLVDLPDRAGRRSILEIHTRGKPLAGGVDLDRIARDTQGFSGADLANVANEAALLTARRNLKEIGQSLLEEAVDRSMLGVSSRGSVLTDLERRMSAYHEAGHAIVGHLLPGTGELRKLSIVRRGHALGQTLVQEDFDRVVHTRSGLLDRIALGLGGRVAEEVVFGEPTSGANSDLIEVGRLARMMVAELGMSESVGPIVLPQAADEVREEIDREVRRIVDEARELARSVLLGARAALDRVAAALLVKETLDPAEFADLVSDAEPVLRAMPASRNEAAAPHDR